MSFRKRLPPSCRNINKVTYHPSQTGISDAIRLYSTDATTRRFVDRLQTDLKCCGSANFTDWLTFRWSTSTSSNADLVAIPKSCCDNKTRTASPITVDGGGNTSGLVAAVTSVRTKNGSAAVAAFGGASSFVSYCVTVTPRSRLLDLTPATTGCKAALVGYLSRTLVSISVALLLLAGLEVVIASQVFVAALAPTRNLTAELIQQLRTKKRLDEKKKNGKVINEDDVSDDGGKGMAQSEAKSVGGSTATLAVNRTSTWIVDQTREMPAASGRQHQPPASWYGDYRSMYGVPSYPGGYLPIVPQPFETPPR